MLFPLVRAGKIIASSTIRNLNEVSTGKPRQVVKWTKPLSPSTQIFALCPKAKWPNLHPEVALKLKKKYDIVNHIPSPMKYVKKIETLSLFHGS
jgi:hypothetical protein